MPHCFILFASFIMMASIVTPYAYAAANIMLFPTRIIVNEKNRYAVLEVKNTGNAIGQFRLELTDMIMDEQGAVRNLEPEEDHPYSAIPHLRLAPKSFSLAPGESQVVRVLIRNRSQLPNGELRGHIRARIVDDNVGQSTPEQKLSIKANLVLVIPVFIRKGAVDYDVSLSKPALTRMGNQSFLAIDVHREGAYSSIGSLHVQHHQQGRSKQAGKLEGFPVYREAEKRQARVPLEHLSAAELSEGELEIIYQDIGPNALAPITRRLTLP